MDELRFEVTDYQQRAMLVSTRIVAVVALAVTFAWLPLLGLKGVRAFWLAWGPGGLALGALISLYAYWAYSRAYAVCSSSEIRTKGLAGRREASWADVTDVSLMVGVGVIRVRAKGGRKFWLGAPIDSAVVRDPAVVAKYMAILQYWRSASETA
jgi:hypothetical protein